MKYNIPVPRPALPPAQSRFAARMATLLAALALSGALALSACGTAALGSEPTVESDPIVASGEDAVSTVVAANKAQNADFVNITPDSAAVNAADLPIQDAANKAQGVLTALGLAAESNEPWEIRYIPADTDEAISSNAGRSYFSCFKPFTKEDNLQCRLDGITGRLFHLIASVPPASTATPAEHTFAALFTRGLPTNLTADALSAVESIYAAALPEAQTWLQNDAANYVNTLTDAWDLTGDWQYSGVVLPATAAKTSDMQPISYTASISGQSYRLDLNPFQKTVVSLRASSALTALQSQAVAAAGNGIEKLPLDDAAASAAAGIENLPNDAANSAASPAADGAESYGWYVQGEDGNWYHVNPDGTRDDAAAQQGGAQ